MDFEMIHVLFKFGRVFSVTPSDPGKYSASFFEKMYALCVFLFYTVGCIVCMYNKWPSYIQYPATRLVLSLMLDCVLYSYTYDSIIGMMFSKRRHFLKLLKNMKRVDGESEVPEDRRSPYFGLFIGAHALKMISMLLFTYVWTNIYGLDVLKKYAVQLLQTFTQFFQIFFAHVVLRMLLVRYRRVTGLMKKKISLVSVRNPSDPSDLNAIRKSIFTLKRSVCGFNRVFGWTILTFIFFGVLTNLMYVDTIIRSEEFYRGKSAGWIVLHTACHCETLATFWVNIDPKRLGTLQGLFQLMFVAIAVLCDAIVDEHAEMTSLAHKMELASKRPSVDRLCEIGGFIAAVSEYEPRFTAARFFGIGRSSIFSVLNSVTTFLLVMIQFKAAP